MGAFPCLKKTPDPLLRSKGLTRNDRNVFPAPLLEIIVSMETSPHPVPLYKGTSIVHCRCQ